MYKDKKPLMDVLHSWPNSNVQTLIVIFSPQVTLPEHTPPGSAVVTVTATDRDSAENGKITYRVMSSTQEGFYIDPNNGRQPRIPLRNIVTRLISVLLPEECLSESSLSLSSSMPIPSRNLVHQSQS